MSNFSEVIYPQSDIKYQQLYNSRSSHPISHPDLYKKDLRRRKSYRIALYCLSGFVVVFAGVMVVFCAINAMREDLSDQEEHTVVSEGPIASNESESLQQCNIDENNRFDCWPERLGGTKEKCNERGCCWKPSSQPNTAPYCFFPVKAGGYNISSLTKHSRGYTGTLKRSTKTFFSKDVMTVQLIVDYINEFSLRIKLFDPANARFEVPLKLSTNRSNDEGFSPLYDVTIFKEPFNLLVTRVKTGESVFDTRSTAPLIFSDQFLQIATQLSSKFLYGLGEHRNNFLQDLTTWRRLVFWNRDSPPSVDNNGYGSHPFFLNLEQSRVSPSGPSNAHGVFLLNSNAGEVALQPFTSNGKETGALTFRMLGGILDFYIVLGPDPVNVVGQYTNLIGRPYMPPFWSLGFHLCKYGYKSGQDLTAVIERNRAAAMPYDVQWTDIDYMSEKKDWTLDQNKFANLPSIVKDLHSNKQRYMIIVDPGISSTAPAGTYPPWDDGKTMDVFVKNFEGDILIGKVWPGLTAFPDFFHPNATAYWYKQAKRFHDIVPYDGLWMDMNEPSNFVSGSAKGCDPSNLNNPPYVPPTIRGGSLMSFTVCPSAWHSLSSHYNLHNMYGWSEANVTRQVVEKIFPNRRTPLITRSSFPGSGHVTGHWLGDNNSAFKEMFYSIPGILNFNLFGVPQIGADICGFINTTTPELCVRWHQLGAFYPFMRNHADINSPPQDPASFSSPHRDYIRSALVLRYRLLAVLYNAFFEAHVHGSPIVRPLFFLYPGTEAIDKQFMWADQILVTPVLDSGATTVEGYFPHDTWYDFFDGSAVEDVGQTVVLNASLDTINIHVRGGTILPLLPPTTRTDDSRQQSFELLVAPDSDGLADGFLFWDDGESSDSITGEKYSHILFNLEKSTLTGSVVKSGYRPERGVRLGSVTALGLTAQPSQAMVNGVGHNFTFNADTKVLTLLDLDVNLLSPLTVTWS